MSSEGRVMKIPHWLPEDKRPQRPYDEIAKPKIERVIAPITRFLHVEAAGGLVLMACLAIALIVANSPWAGPYNAFWQTRIGFKVGEFTLNKPLLLWINDGLMTVFFFLVGLEIKREIVFGELRDPRKAAFPAAAALGGMIVPAAVYLAFQWGQPGSRGWGVPMATDIAFVVGVLALLGKRVPTGMKLLLLTLAIIDDIGSVIVIAVVYTNNLAPMYFIPAAAGFGIVYLFNRIGVRPIPIYVALGAGIWLAFLKSGVHPTVAGVLLGLLTPAYSWFSGHSLAKVAEGVSQQLQQDEQDSKEKKNQQKEAALLLSKTAKEAISPLVRLETAIHPWVMYTIMPLFALANAGVAIDFSALGSSVALAVAAGLVVGKPVGIVLFSLAAVKLGLASLPTGVNWKSMIGAGCLAGIGFTMSLFIAGLALEGELLTAGKVGTLSGSLISAALGLTILIMTLGKPKKYVPQAPKV
jgi:NhaA family Na+:H+ antiporter